MITCFEIVGNGCTNVLWVWAFEFGILEFEIWNVAIPEVEFYRFETL